ncbi:MAG: methyltransferase domain-containing protein, partial [Firmicutes bacterium]|nr:methyltransferase domain-containing protein [Bacillota bacterium]
MRIDETGFGSLKLIQDPDEFCYGTDAVLLAKFAKLQSGLKLCDICTGNGAVAFIADYLYKSSECLGIDINSHEIELANESAKLNNLEDHMRFIALDALDLKKSEYFEHFDAALMNPPYQVKGSGVSGDRPEKHAARFETTADLRQLFEAAALLVLFVALLALYIKRRRDTCAAYLAGYGVVRFCMEFFRGD